jgi:DNA-binding CsgD family transcriptional regulator
MEPRYAEEDPSTPTLREIEVLKLLASGLSTKQVAISLEVSFKTAVGHRSRLMEKLRTGDVAGLTRYAIRNGYIDALGSRGAGPNQEILARQVQFSYAEYKQTMDAYNAFLKERESMGLANPDGSAGARRLREAEKQAHRKYHAALVALKDFLLPGLL